MAMVPGGIITRASTKKEEVSRSKAWKIAGKCEVILAAYGEIEFPSVGNSVGWRTGEATTT